MIGPLEVWKRLGGAGEVPHRLGACRGALLVIGGGRGVWEDYAKVRPWKGEIMAVNDVGQHLPELVAHWATLHPEYLPGWRAFRAGHCYGEGRMPLCHSQKAKPGVDLAWRVHNLGGTSGLFAVLVGLMLGYEEIVLAGVPMDGGGHYFDPPWTTTDFGDDGAVASVWQWSRGALFDNRVKSLSGKTRDWLGAPQ